MNKKLIKLRIDRGLNQEEAAKEIGISQSMLSALEQGYRSGSDATKIKIASFYDQSVESIFFAGKITKRDSKMREKKNEQSGNYEKQASFDNKLESC